MFIVKQNIVEDEGHRLSICQSLNSSLQVVVASRSFLGPFRACRFPQKRFFGSSHGFFSAHEAIFPASGSGASMRQELS